MRTLPTRLSDPVAVVVHTLVLLVTAGSAGILPILATVRHDFGLSATELSIMLALPSISMIALSLPLGRLSDRVGPRRLTLWAAALYTISCALMAIHTVVPFTLGRLLFGVSMTAVWTSGPAWLGDSRPRSSGRVSAMVASSSVGTIAGPTVVGVMADHFGISAPFAVLAVAGGLVTATFAFGRGRRRRPPLRPERLLGARTRVLRDPFMVAAVAAMIAVGAASGAVQLLIPLQLSHSGLTDSAIGVVLSVSGLINLATSTTASRVGSWAVTASTIVVACALLGVALVPAAVWTASAAVILAMLAFTVPRAQLNTFGYRLAATSAHGSEGGLGSKVSLLNLAWAVSMAVGPPAAGLAEEHLGIRAAIMATAMWSVALGLALLAYRTSTRDRWATTEG